MFCLFCFHFAVSNLTILVWTISNCWYKIYCYCTIHVAGNLNMKRVPEEVLVGCYARVIMYVPEKLVMKYHFVIFPDYYRQPSKLIFHLQPKHIEQKHKFSFLSTDASLVSFLSSFSVETQLDFLCRFFNLPRPCHVDFLFSVTRAQN